MSFLSFIGDTISSIFGGSTQASRAQGRDQNLANQYGSQAAAGYQGLQAQGQQDLSLFNQIFPGLLGQYFQTAGLSNPIGGPQPPAGQVTVGGVPQKTTTNAQGRVTNTANPPPQTPQAPNPYGLTPAMQTQLNTLIGQNNQAMQTSLSNYREQLAAQGIDDPRAAQAGEAMLARQYAAQNEAAAAQFGFEAQQQKLAQLMQLIGVMSGQQSQGAQFEEAASSGYGSLAGAAQNQANIAQAQDNSMNSNLLNLLSFGLGGGFNTGGGAGAAGGGTPPIIAPNNSAGGYDPLNPMAPYELGA